MEHLFENKDMVYVQNIRSLVELWTQDWIEAVPHICSGGSPLDNPDLELRLLGMNFMIGHNLFFPVLYIWVIIAHMFVAE